MHDDEKTEPKGEQPQSPPPQSQPSESATTSIKDKTTSYKTGAEDPSFDEEHDDRRRSHRRSYNSGHDFITKEMRERAASSSLKLRTYLTGIIAIVFTDKNATYVIDWTSDTMVVTEKERNDKTDAKPIDCTISISEQSFMRVVSGDLNPQMAMLSSGLKVSGKTALAVYFFNLVAP